MNMVRRHNVAVLQFYRILSVIADCRYIINALLLQLLALMGRITSRSCARKGQITLVFDSRDPVFPAAATRRDPTHQIKLLK